MHAMLIVAVTPQHCATIQKKLKNWLKPDPTKKG